MTFYLKLYHALFEFVSICIFLTKGIQETDKATIDVEAQDDGIVGKILV